MTKHVLIHLFTNLWLAITYLEQLPSPSLQISNFTIDVTLLIAAFLSKLVENMPFPFTLPDRHLRYPYLAHALPF